MKRAILMAAAVMLAVGCAGAFAQQPQQQTQDVFVYRALGEAALTQAARTNAQDFKFEQRVTGPVGAEQKFMFMTNEFVFEGKPVKGAPYSADSVNESVQTLADGNRIVHSSTSKIYRDSEGRTRRELSGAMPAAPIQIMTSPAGAGGGVMGGMVSTATLRPAQAPEAHPQIVINDPVAGVNYVLDPEARTARKMSVTMVSVKDPAIAAAMDKAKKEMALTGRATATVEEPGKKFVINMEHKTSEKSPLDARNESLGTMTIEGVECEGTRSTITIPAGQMGNELPIVITSERWYSPKLQTVVLSRHHDPRSGDTTVKLVGVSLSEPPASLFQVPGDYTMVDAAKYKIGATVKESK